MPFASTPASRRPITADASAGSPSPLAGPWIATVTFGTLPPIPPVLEPPDSTSTLVIPEVSDCVTPFFADSVTDPVSATMFAARRIPDDVLVAVMAPPVDVIASLSDSTPNDVITTSPPALRTVGVETVPVMLESVTSPTNADTCDPSAYRLKSPTRDDRLMLPPDESTSPTSVTVPAASTVTAVAARILFTVTGPAVATTSTAPPSALSDCVSAPRSIAPARLFTEMSPSLDRTTFTSMTSPPAESVTSCSPTMATLPVGPKASARLPVKPVIVTRARSPTLYPLPGFVTMMEIAPQMGVPVAVVPICSTIASACACVPPRDGGAITTTTVG